MLDFISFRNNYNSKIIVLFISWSIVCPFIVVVVIVAVAFNVTNTVSLADCCLVSATFKPCNFQNIVGITFDSCPCGPNSTCWDNFALSHTIATQWTRFNVCIKTALLGGMHGSEDVIFTSGRSGLRGAWILFNMLYSASFTCLTLEFTNKDKSRTMCWWKITSVAILCKMTLVIPGSRVEIT